MNSPKSISAPLQTLHRGRHTLRKQRSLSTHAMPAMRRLSQTSRSTSPNTIGTKTRPISSSNPLSGDLESKSEDGIPSSPECSRTASESSSAQISDQSPSLDSSSSYRERGKLKPKVLFRTKSIYEIRSPFRESSDKTISRSKVRFRVFPKTSDDSLITKTKPPRPSNQESPQNFPLKQRFQSQTLPGQVLSDNETSPIRREKVHKQPQSPVQRARRLLFREKKTPKKNKKMRKESLEFGRRPVPKSVHRASIADLLNSSPRTKTATNFTGVMLELKNDFKRTSLTESRRSRPRSDEIYRV